MNSGGNNQNRNTQQRRQNPQPPPSTEMRKPQSQKPRPQSGQNSQNTRSTRPSSGSNPQKYPSVGNQNRPLVNSTPSKDNSPGKGKSTNKNVHNTHRKAVRRPTLKPEIKLTKPVRKRYGKGINPGAVLSVLIFVIIIIISIMGIMQSRNEDNGNDNDTGTTPSDTVSVSGADDTNASEPNPLTGQTVPSPGDENFIGPVQPEDEITVPKCDYIAKSQTDIFTGDLILVNADHAYVFPETPNISRVYDNKSSAYKLSTTAEMLDTDVLAKFNKMIDDFYAAKSYGDILLRSGYRDFETQKSVYDSRVASQGEEQAKLYVATPGYSEHHTGMAMDLSTYSSSGESKAIGDVEQCQWLIENAYKYGFVIRYPADKIAITGIGYEPWHYRYVGAPFAYIMESQSLCLEEFIEMIYDYTWNGKTYDITDNEGTEWRLYYVKGKTDGDTQVPVPINSEYIISGNNIDGFIVAAK